jgi:branched-chain amino acid transport system ATP-binding protein
MKFLNVEKITKSFGGLRAVDRVFFSVKEGEILGIIGHNGAGKTTLFNLMTGVLKPSEGRIFFQGEDVAGLSTAEVAAKGMVRTFQASAYFRAMTVFENIAVAHHLMNRAPFWNFLLNFPSVRVKEEKSRKKTEEIIDFFGMTSLHDELAENLAHGYQRALGICIALAAEPRVLLLDEPVTGMNPVETAAMMELIRKLRDKGITIVVIEHDMKALMGVCDRVIALSSGRVITEGSPAEIQRNPEVIESYLGREEDYGVDTEG